MVVPQIPAPARAAAQEGDWTLARHTLEGVDDPSIEVLDALADACWWLDDPRGAVAAWERAYHLRLDRGDAPGACRTAVRIAWEYALAIGNDAAANGWLQRARDAIDDDRDRSESGWITLCEAVRTIDPERALTDASRALEIARRFSDRTLEIYALAQVGIGRVQLGRVDEGIDALDDALAGATDGGTGDPRTLGDTFCALTEACMTAGDMSRSEQWMDVFNDYMSRYRHPTLLSFCAACEAEQQIVGGHWADAERTLHAALASLDGGIRRARCIHPAALLASIRVDQSRFEEAEQLLVGLEDLPETVLPRAELFTARGEPSVAAAILRRRVNEVGADSILAAPVLASLVRADIARGDVAAATATTEQLERLAERSQRPRDEAAAALARGRIAFSRGELDAARGTFERALDLNGKCGLPLEAARTRRELARVARAAGDAPLSIEEARIALATFQQVGAIRDADITSRLLRELGATGRPGPKGLETLTGREREVLGLLGQGLTNAEIAARLFISSKTAGHHVSNILAKLGVRNRSEAGAYARRYSELEPR